MVESTRGRTHYTVQFSFPAHEMLCLHFHTDPAERTIESRLHERTAARLFYAEK